MISRTITPRSVRQAHRRAARESLIPSRQWTRLMAPALAMLLFCSCGGSGSSGFDSALRSESDAIGRANAEGSCVEFRSTTYCASGAPVTIGGDPAAVDFDEAGGPLPCTQLPGEPGCTGEVGFEPGGFPETTVFLGAWAEDESGPWTLSSVDQTGPGGGDANGDVVVVLPDDGATPDALVIAVLVYFDGVPDEVPEVARRLRGFGPDVVYFNAGVEVEVAPATAD